jgi:hypothetical protein
MLLEAELSVTLEIVTLAVENPPVTLSGALIVTVCGVAVPLSAPLKPVNEYPLLAVALTWTEVPLLYHPLAGLIVPPAEADVVR